MRAPGLHHYTCSDIPTSVVVPRQTSQGIKETEWDLLGVLWEAERATAREVADALQDSRGWAYSTVKTLLDRMAERGLVRARMDQRDTEL